MFHTFIAVRNTQNKPSHCRADRDEEGRRRIRRESHHTKYCAVITLLKATKRKVRRKRQRGRFL